MSIKKIIGITTALILMIFLSACGDNRVRADLEVMARRTMISVDVTLIDPHGLVSTAVGSFTVTLHDQEDDNRQVSAHTLSSTAEGVQTHDFDGLRIDHVYTIRVHVIRQGSSHMIREERNIKTIDEGGSREEAIRIYDKAGFLNIRRDALAYYIIENDIDLENETILSMFTLARPFNGTIFSEEVYCDDEGYRPARIHNFRIMQAAANSGIFGVIGSEGLIEDVDFHDIRISFNRAVGTNVGTLAGINRGTIRNVSIYDVDFIFRASGSGTMAVGGVVGSNEDRGLIENVTIDSLDMNVTLRNMSFVGGIAGRNRNTFGLGPDLTASIINSRVRNFELEVLPPNDFSTSVLAVHRIGGFVGENSSIIRNAVSEFKLSYTFNVIATTEDYRAYIGGFAGSNIWGGSIENVVTASQLSITSATLANLRTSLFVAQVLEFSVADTVLILEAVSSIKLNIAPSALFEMVDCSCTNEVSCGQCPQPGSGTPSNPVCQRCNPPVEEANNTLDDDSQEEEVVRPCICRPTATGDRLEDLSFIIGLVSGSQGVNERFRNIFVLSDLPSSLAEEGTPTQLFSWLTLHENMYGKTAQEFADIYDLVEINHGSVTLNNLGEFADFSNYIHDILAAGSLLRPVTPIGS